MYQTDASVRFTFIIYQELNDAHTVMFRKQALQNMTTFKINWEPLKLLLINDRLISGNLSIGHIDVEPSITEQIESAQN